MHYKLYKQILSAKNGMNIYRGCTHGCIYCDSRSKCYNMQHDFEDIEVKLNAPQILEDTLMRRREKCMVGTGAMTDPYIHLDAQLQNTRKCLEVIEKYGFGLAIQTKSDRILRDLDVLKRINERAKVVVQMTMTTYDEGLCRLVEPDVSTTKARFEVLKVMRDAGIATVVWLSPLLPFINDTVENVQGILDYCVEAKVHGVLYFGAGVTLREGNREYFYRALDRDFPGVKRKYMARFGSAYVCDSPNAQVLDALVKKTCADNGILCGSQVVFEYLHAFESRRVEEQIKFEF